MQAPAGLIPDAPVPEYERWYRLLTNTDYVTREGTVHYQALKGKAFQAPERKPWAHELSGQLASQKIRPRRDSSQNGASSSFDMAGSKRWTAKSR